MIQYETVNTEVKLAQLNSAIAGQEQQHYQLVIEKIANAGNPAAVDNLNAQLRIREQAIANLRTERDREKAAASVSAPSAPQEPPAEPSDAGTPDGPPATP